MSSDVPMGPVPAIIPATHIPSDESSGDEVTLAAGLQPPTLESTSEDEEDEDEGGGDMETEAAFAALASGVLARGGLAAAAAAAAVSLSPHALPGCALPDSPLDDASRFEASLEHALGTLAYTIVHCGEALLDVGGDWGPSGLDESQLETCVARVVAAADGLGADAVVLRKRRATAPDDEVGEGTDPGTEAAAADDFADLRRSGRGGVGGSGHAADVLVRPRARPETFMELRVAVIGNVDSGKSTFVGVLTRSMLDDGRGAARSKVFSHAHERDSGRTSCIGQHNLCLSSRGAILNDPSFRSATCSETVALASKVITLVDLAGHERYFKTTAFGLTGHLPDYACLMVGANAGVIGMCKEHLGIALALKVPVFFVVTKVDMSPEHVTRQTVADLCAILRKPGVRKRPFKVATVDDVYVVAKHMAADSLAPIFLTSAVDGTGLDLVRLFFNLLPQRTDWSAAAAEHAEFVIDETFSVPGVGTVVAGTVKKGVITLGGPGTLLLGPDVADGSFKPAAIKSIHYKRMSVTRVVAGQTAALALKKTKRGAVRKGMVLADERLKPRASWEFDAEIAILTHATTIAPRYQAVIHCEIIRQSARVVAMDRDRLRSGDRAAVRFRFMNRPEYITPGMRFVFREGRTKGIGLIVK